MTSLQPVPVQGVRSFHDLRAFAADPASGAATTETGDAFLASRRMLELPEGPVSVAAMTLAGGEGRIERLPGDEFLILLSGELRIDAEGAPLAMKPNDSVVLPGGLGFGWSAAPGTTAIAMRCTSGPAGADRPVLIDPAGPLAPSGAPLAELLVGPTPSCRNRTDYRSANSEFTCGVWDSTPYHRRAMLYRIHELMHLLRGAVSFVDGAGRQATFREGDIFLVEQGAECSWLSEVQVAKVFAIHRPA